MIRTYVPKGPLASFVDAIWHYEGPRAPQARERILPTGAMKLILDLGPGTVVGPLACGARSTPLMVETHRATSVMGVAFAPGGAFPFLGAPAGELQDDVVPLGSLWGRRASELQERLAEAPTAGHRFRLLEGALLAGATRPLERHPAVAAALVEFLRGPTAPAIGAVARRVGLSPRRFIQVFRGQVGMPPKLFCRVRRFQAVLRAAGDGRPVDWAAVALSCGYADQAHLIRDFRAFSGLTPTAYLAAWGVE